MDEQKFRLSLLENQETEPEHFNFNRHLTLSSEI